jgi:hypothetical protein
MLRATFGTTNQDAAILLLKVRAIAFDELLHSKKLKVDKTSRRFKPNNALSFHPSLIADISQDSSRNRESCFRDANDCCHVQTSSPLKRRLRTISLCSSSEADIEPNRSCTGKDGSSCEATCDVLPEALYPYDPKISDLAVDPSFDYSSSSYSTTISDTLDSPTSKFKVLSCVSPTAMVPTESVATVMGHESTTSYVRNRVEVKNAKHIRNILKKKFSWKSFPELEKYLIDHRVQYLQYSNQLNYTAEQKRYNNWLTQGLLDLAAEEGYIFEDFTFAAVRDRIRCYYKSYVQAAKKKKQNIKSATSSLKS